MTMKKTKCDILRCRAACCYNVPLEKGYLTAFRKKIVNPVIGIKPYGREKDSEAFFKRYIGRIQYQIITDENPEKNKCPFLRPDCRCNIYNSRPAICRKFGFSPERFLNCEFLSGHRTDDSYNAVINDFAGLMIKKLRGEKLI